MFSGAFPAAADGPYFVPDLPYPYEALEPHIDAATMKVCFIPLLSTAVAKWTLDASLPGYGLFRNYLHLVSLSGGQRVPYRHRQLNPKIR